MAPHFIIFPFMAQGHIIPLLRFARLLHSRGVIITVFTTPANSPSIRTSLTGTTISVHELPFPVNIPGVPPGIESTDKLPSMSSFLPFANATKQIQPDFERAMETLLPPAHCIISDSFLSWTQESAAKLGIPRVVFYGISNYTMSVCEVMIRERPHAGISSMDESFVLPNFSRIKLTRNDFEPPFSELEVDPKDELSKFTTEHCKWSAMSYGIVVNSFYELEPSFHDYWNNKIGPRAWCVGPFSLVQLPTIQDTKTASSSVVQWLDKKLAIKMPVLYVAFGSQADISHEQLEEIAIGLEGSDVSFLWALKSMSLEFLKGFEERVNDRGLIVREWVDQMEILGHQAVDGFLSHCGWNSVMESICKGVPILALPLMAEQHLNARMVVDEIGIGLRIMPSNGSFRGVVRSEEVERMVRELMKGDNGKEMRKKVGELKEAACNAMEEGGSSRTTLGQFIDEVCSEGRSQEYE